MVSEARRPVEVASRRQSLAPIVLALAVAAAAFWCLNRAADFTITDDGIRDQLMVRDCADLGRCHLIGAPTSLPGFVQGAVWLDLLLAVRLLGGDAQMQRTVVLALLALSAATLFVVVWRWLRPSIALPAAALLVWVLTLHPYPSQLINPSPSAFPDVIAAAGLLCFALAGRFRFLIVSAFALGAAINVHVGALSLVPPFLVVAALGLRPWRALLAASVVLIATCIFTSSAAFFANLAGLASYVPLSLAALVGLAIVFVSARLGRHFRALSWDARAWLVGALLLLPFGLATTWLIVREGHHFGLTYLHPILGPGAVFAAAIAVAPFELVARWVGPLRWVPAVAAMAGLAFLGDHLSERRPDSSAWTFEEAGAIADQVARRGWSYEDAVFHVQGYLCRELIAAMAAVAPPPAAPTNHGRRQLQVSRAGQDAAAAVADPGDFVPFGPGNGAIVREIESWLQPGSLVACRVPTDSARSPLCSSPMQMAPDKRTPERFLFLTRSFPGIHSIDVAPPYVARYEIPLAPAAGEDRELVLADRASEGDCAWRITRVEGVRVDGALPGRRVRLHSDDGAAGVLVVEKPFGVAKCTERELDMRYPPCVLETQPGDPIQRFLDLTRAFDRERAAVV